MSETKTGQARAELPSHELFSVSLTRDWPWSEEDNGNYINECWACGEKYRGHKHSRQCAECYTKAKLRWAAMNQDERDAHNAKVTKEIAEYYSENDQALASLPRATIESPKTEEYE